ncbi:MAG TPA: hypothetical protein DCL38_08825 [Lachnospiraceae bacterium]|nr:hypothetical protein [Lachnospiraceae bacterium]
MLNIEVQACGLALVLLLLFFSTRHEKLGLYSEHLFRVSLVVNLFCIVLDILSVIGIVYAELIPSFVTVFLCKLYLVSLLSASYMGFVYSYSDVKKMRENTMFTRSQVVLEFVGAFLIMILPLHYYREGRIVYSYGPSTMCTFIFAPVFITGAIVTTLVYRKQINQHRRRAVQSWMLMELVAAGIQFIRPDILLVGFGSSLGMMILYAELENPDAFLDRVTGTFAYRVLRDYLRQLYEDGKSFSCVMVCSDVEWRLEPELEHKILLDMADYLHQFRGIKLFRSVGNDFILVYRDTAEGDHLLRSSADIRAIRRRFDNNWDNVHIGTSILYLPDSELTGSADELISLYQYYRAGLDEDKHELVVLNEDSVDRIKEYKTVLKEIIQALENDRIDVFYQPIYSFEEGRFVSAEALARIVDSNGNIMMPARFIPVAEESRLIEQIGERVFEKTCIALKDGRLNEMGIRYIEVNLSVVQCENNEFSSVYSEIMNRHGLTFDKVNLEITESSSLNRRTVFLDNMKALKEAGCSFALDDFGTGESNLNYIVDMPVDIVKFDRSMVMKYFTSEKARIVMTNSVKMVKELGYRIVAEGIEQYDQLMSMKSLGVDYIQGFYFSKPLPYEKFVKFIESNNRKDILNQM